MRTWSLLEPGTKEKRDSIYFYRRFLDWTTKTMENKIKTSLEFFQYSKSKWLSGVTTIDVFEPVANQTKENKNF